MKQTVSSTTGLKRAVCRGTAVLVLVACAVANTTGPNAPASAAVSGTGTAWSSPASALTSDGVFASVFVSPGGTSNQLQVTNFGFAIPAGATINGIQVDTQNQSPNAGQLSILIQALKSGAAGLPSPGPRRMPIPARRRL